MQTTLIWHKHHIYCTKIIVTLLLCCCCGFAWAQKNAYENDLKFQRKRYHFGIHLGVSMADYRIRHSEDFTLSDSVLAVKSNLTLGYEIGALGSFHINRFLELRTLPSFIFNDKNLNFEYSDGTKKDYKLSNIIFDLPIEIKFKSEAIGNFKVYVIGGMKYSYDIGSNLSGRIKTFIPQQKPNDFSINYGAGFELHFPLFILCPEFKVSNSVLNTNKPTDRFIHSNMINRIYNRTFLFSLNFEG